ncbi:hypothetical protein B0H17DRAFT_1040146 [Mycena rosella]|uniref:Uncharacterized protein n=1 Tax=Mycena rosella TaxID=1033263 RepID=A0AAD7GRU8_MYCRO|nr:hypothetical protein B0H17DRAFT_1040146 [Mycena rosella]
MIFRVVARSSCSALISDKELPVLETCRSPTPDGHLYPSISTPPSDSAPWQCAARSNDTEIKDSPRRAPLSDPHYHRWPGSLSSRLLQPTKPSFGQENLWKYAKC